MFFSFENELITLFQKCGQHNYSVAESNDNGNTWRLLAAYSDTTEELLLKRIKEFWYNHQYLFSSF